MHKNYKNAHSPPQFSCGLLHFAIFFTDCCTRVLTHASRFIGPIATGGFYRRVNGQKVTQRNQPTAQPIIHTRTWDTCADMTVVRAVESIMRTSTRSWPTVSSPRNHSREECTWLITAVWTVTVVVIHRCPRNSLRAIQAGPRGAFRLVFRKKGRVNPAGLGLPQSRNNEWEQREREQPEAHEGKLAASCC